tara:strand:- start:1070 stop:1840 length:771 start_codon:yes stop_codon:yes gene_type:complete
MVKIKPDSQSDEYLFALLGVENFRPDSLSRLRHYFNFIRNNAHEIEGDIWEFGVFKGVSLCATALLLKEIGSDKKVFGMDSFSGFPSYHRHDSLDQFRLKCPSIFSENFRDMAEQSHEIVARRSLRDSQAANISSSGAFDDTSVDLVRAKLKEYDLDNVVLIEGPFEDTIPEITEVMSEKIFAANIDCDLYSGYEVALPFCWRGLVDGGFIHLDEYYSLKFPGAKIATDEFCSSKNIKPVRMEGRPGEFERWALLK